MPIRPIEIAIEDLDHRSGRLAAALADLSRADADFSYGLDHESGLTLLQADSEAQLDDWLGVLKQTADINVGAPGVAYRETLGRRVEITRTGPLGPTDTLARLTLVFEPGEPGSDFVFEDAAPGNPAPRDCREAVRRALEIAARDGLLAGFPVMDFKATLVAVVGDDHAALQRLAHEAFRALRQEGAPVLLEPVTAVEVTAPEALAGQVKADLRTRHAVIEGEVLQDGRAVVRALVPQSNLFGYHRTLHDLTGGEGRASLRYSHHAPVPQDQPEAPLFPPAVGLRA